MPHERARHLSGLLQKTFRFSPITGIFGHRQVGKTTLAASLGGQYITLDTAQDQAAANLLPDAFLARLCDPAKAREGAPAVIDECQLAPPLFPAMKEWVRQKKKPGQFLLTGSVRFTSRKAIRESLTGRIISWELLPMDWAEQHSRPLANSLLRLLDSSKIDLDLPTATTFTPESYLRALDQGGLPGVFAVRDRSIRAQRFETQLNTILERDLRLLIDTTVPYKNLRRLLSGLAAQVGQPLSLAILGKESGISLPTVRKLLSAFEALFLIRFIDAEGDYRKPIVFFEDIGEMNHVSKQELPVERRLLAFLYQNLRTQWHYRPDERIRAFYFRKRSGCEVPLCIERGKSTLAIIPVSDDESLAPAVRNAKLFLKLKPQAKILLVSPDQRDQMLSRQIRWLGAGRLLAS